MENSQKIIIFGRDHEVKSEIFYQVLDFVNIALGTSAGVTSKPNEDSAGASVYGTDIVLAIADGHWGREASEIAVMKAMELLGPEIRPSRKNETQARLFALFEQVNNQFYEMATSAPGALTPETTLIVCQIQEVEDKKYIYWSSFGDSYLFLLRGKKLKQLNTLQPRWLGYLSKLSEKSDTRSLLMRFLTDEARYVGVANGLETGIETLEQGDIVFLCTDGLVGSDREPDPSILDSIWDILSSDLSPAARVERLIASALDRQEKDNVSCVLALLS